MATDETAWVHELSQDEWDELNRRSQSRRSRARSLNEHALQTEPMPEPEVQLPAPNPQQSPAVNLLTFAGPAALLRRFPDGNLEGLDLLHTDGAIESL